MAEESKESKLLNGGFKNIWIMNKVFNDKFYKNEQCIVSLFNMKN